MPKRSNYGELSRPGPQETIRKILQSEEGDIFYPGWFRKFRTSNDRQIVATEDHQALTLAVNEMLEGKLLGSRLFDKKVYLNDVVEMMRIVAGEELQKKYSIRDDFYQSLESAVIIFQKSGYLLQTEHLKMIQSLRQVEILENQANQPNQPNQDLTGHPPLDRENEVKKLAEQNKKLETAMAEQTRKIERLERLILTMARTEGANAAELPRERVLSLGVFRPLPNDASSAPAMGSGVQTKP